MAIGVIGTGLRPIVMCVSSNSRQMPGPGFPGVHCQSRWHAADPGDPTADAVYIWSCPTGDCDESGRCDHRPDSRRSDLASALSQGDISGGIKAMMELRKARMNQASQSQIESLNASREREKALLKENGLTKEQISLKNEKLSLDKKEIEQIIAGEEQKIKWFGMTKLQIDNAAKALDLSKTAGLNINDPNFLNNILDAAKGKADSLASAVASAVSQFNALLAAQDTARSTYTNLPPAGTSPKTVVPPPDDKTVTDPKTVVPPDFKIPSLLFATC